MTKKPRGSAQSQDQEDTPPEALRETQPQLSKTSKQKSPTSEGKSSSTPPTSTEPRQKTSENDERQSKPKPQADPPNSAVQSAIGQLEALSHYKEVTRLCLIDAAKNISPIADAAREHAKKMRLYVAHPGLYDPEPAFRTAHLRQQLHEDCAVMEHIASFLTRVQHAIHSATQEQQRAEQKIQSIAATLKGEKTYKRESITQQALDMIDESDAADGEEAQ